ncbi:MAG: CocE/NonD family hydrolase [Rhizobiaceae bacterium]|nr:CocE/NonD family hydrolase [Rhizobiaceae bacterium]
MTQFRDVFPHAVREIENTWIPMPDGIRLAARIWLPSDADTVPVPAVLEFIPYRKRDGMARRDEMMHPWFAGHGYAAIRVDLRGAGDSEGVLDDEYCPQEQEDGLAVIDWISRQPWCSGALGMIGISWGGFNALQIAARRPPALKAIVTVGSTDDRYADDVHTMGGAQLSANFTWAQTFFSDLTRPPDPAIVGERWRKMWMERLENQTFFIERWLAHPTRDSYWKHGSVCEDYGRIECAVLAVGGWADSYTNAVPRLLRNLAAPRRGIIGPWGHDYPHTAIPGPAIGFLQECLRWWEHWLKGKQTDAMQEPLLRVHLQRDLSTAPDHAHRDGEWIGVDDLGPHAPGVWHLGDAGLTSKPQSASSRLVATPQTLGWTAGEWCAYGACADQPADQAVEDGQSVCFDMAPLGEPVEILGAPVVRLRLSSSSDRGTVIVRLNEVDEAGRSARITYGVLDLRHRDGFETAVPLRPGEPVEVSVRLCDIAYRFRPGARIRVAISNTYWPTVWPEGEPVALTLHTEGSVLELPLLDRAAVSTRPVVFAPAEASRPAPRTTLRQGEMQRRLHRDFIGGEEMQEVVVDDGVQRIDAHGLEIGRRCVERYFARPGDPQSPRIEADWTMTLRRGDWGIRTETRSTMRRQGAGYAVDCHVTAFEGERLVFERRHSTST